MESLNSENEQFEQLKRWLKENGVLLVLGFVLGLGGVYGWRGWQSYQVSVSEKASLQLTVAEQYLVNGEHEFAVTQIEELLQATDNALYVDMSRLLLARVRVEQGMLDKAVEPLKTITEDKGSMFNSIARLRLARVYLEQSQLDAAEQLVAGDVDDAYEYAFEEFRGDLELARGEHVAARSAYTKAISLAGVNVDTQFLQMKLDDLPDIKQVD